MVGNAVDVHQAILDKGFKIDIITDQTSAHDPLNGYVPQGYSLEEASALRNKDPKQYVKESQSSMHKHVSLMLEFQKQGAVAFDYGNNIRQVAYNDGLKMLLISLGLYRHILDRYFAKERDHLDLQH